MKRFLLCIAALFLLRTITRAQSYGLVFSSHEVVQEKRTALDLSPDDSICLAGNFTLSFDINFLPRHEIYFGYVLRIIAVGNPGSEQNIDLIYNQALKTFKVIVGENFSGISFSVDSMQLYRDWTRFTLHADLDKHRLEFIVNDHPVGNSPIPGPAGAAIGGASNSPASNSSASSNCFKFLWGANDFRKFRTRDIPPMQVKDIHLTDGAVRYEWPLDETTGETSMDKIGRHPARIKNPVWLKPKYQQWELIGSFSVNGYAGAAYDPGKDKLYITGADSLAAYSFTKDGFTTDWIPTRHMEFLIGHQTIYDTLTDHLLDVFVDRKAVSAFSFSTRQWDQNLTYGPLTEYWHANKFISPADTSLYVFGGYGQLHYKNGIHRYHFGHWDSIRTTGDYLPPRYLSALGATDKYAYILGGYGSQTGDQMLDPRNYYDLFRYDIKKRAFKKLLTLKTLPYPFAFANSMVITHDAWYGLTFANDVYDSRLQLITGSFTDSAYHLVGSAIPYAFHDVQSFADLYYSPQSNKLIAVTLFYTKYTADNQKDKNTQVRIYTLSYPPEPVTPAAATLTVVPARHTPWALAIGILGVVLIGIALTIRLRRKHNTAASAPSRASANSAPAPEPNFAPIPALPLEPPTGPLTSSIYLFGPFQTFDREGHDCTRLFTPLLKELFLIITTYTIRNGRGISSEGLNEILWHDKPEKDAKNNRSVNLAKLKPILEKIGNCSINKESGYWQLQAPDETWLDYKKFAALLQQPISADPRHIHALVDIIKRGPFLLQTEYNWLDDIKSEISNAIIDRCLNYLRHHGGAENPEFTIEVTNCIFYFDQLNEDALTFKCKSLILLKRHNLASNTYLKFVKDYKDIYNADFARSFQEIIA